MKDDAPRPFRYSALAGRAKPSGIRSAQSAEVDIVPFSKGHPSPDLFPAAEMAGWLSEMLSDPARAAESLQYSAGAGTPVLRAALAGLMTRQGLPCAPDNILVTNGSQQGLSLTAMAFAEPGDAVEARLPLYGGALQVYEAFGMTLTEPGDTEPALIYEIPNFHNPTGLSLDLGARTALVGRAHETGAALVEDDPYGMLRYDGYALPGLLALDAERHGIDGARSFYLGSLSKTVAPGLRIGWIVGPRDAIERLALLKYIQDIQSGTLVQDLAAGVLDDGFDARLDTARGFYRANRDALLSALERDFGTRGNWTVPEGGFFLWLTLAGGIEAETLLPHAVERGVDFVPGSAFGPAARFGSCLRLSFSCATPDQIKMSVARLAAAYDAVAASRTG